MSESPKDTEEGTSKGVDDINKVMDECLGKSLETLSTTFAASAKRWEAIVYPSLFAFVLLSSYGFYLIYNLTTDVRRVADSMEHIVGSMNEMTVNMKDMSMNMNVVSHNMVLMTQTMDSQSASMLEMKFHMRNMSASMGQMRHDISVMNNSVSRPMQFMNTFLPW